MSGKGIILNTGPFEKYLRPEGKKLKGDTKLLKSKDMSLTMK